VFRADEAAVRTAAENKHAGAPQLSSEVHGAQAVANVFKGRARGAQRATIDGAPGAVWAQAGQIRAVFLFVVRDGKIVEIDNNMDPTLLSELRVELVAS